MEMAREPSLNAAVFTYYFDEFAAALFITVIEPAAPIHNMILLNDPNAASIRRGMRKDKDAPTLIGGW